jgi:osmotically inducible protein OsmC
MKTLYHAHADATGGRTGHAQTDDGKLNLTLSTPKEVGGDGGGGTNPEQLFASGFAACFLGALKYVAGQEKVKIPEDATVTADIGIGPRDDGKGFGITAALQVKIPGLDRAKAEDLIRKAEIVCPYAHATRGNIESSFTLA